AHEQYEDREGERDQTDKANERFQTPGSAQLRPAGPAAAAGGPPLASAFSRRGVLASRAFIEEVEVEDVVVVRAHARLSRQIATLREPADDCFGARRTFPCRDE